jgi:hypothetical protein
VYSISLAISANLLTQLLQKSAIVMQIQQKIDYEVKSLLPRLHGIANLLSDNPPITRTADLTELLSISSVIYTALGKIFVPNSAPVLLEGAEESPVVLRPQKRHRHQPETLAPLLPPSPELKQRRKESHAPF